MARASPPLSTSCGVPVVGSCCLHRPHTGVPLPDPTRLKAPQFGQR
jgi:hypothetical protein